MRKLLLTAIAIVAPFIASAQINILSDHGTNWQAVVYPPGATNNDTYAVMGVNSTLAPIKVTASNIGTSAFWLVSSTNSASLPVLGALTNAPGKGQIFLAPRESKVLSEFPIFDRKPWSAFTTNAADYGLVLFKIDVL